VIAVFAPDGELKHHRPAETVVLTVFPDGAPATLVTVALIVTMPENTASEQNACRPWLLSVKPNSPFAFGTAIEGKTVVVLFSPFGTPEYSISTFAPCGN
jgi:hypothetical protein